MSRALGCSVTVCLFACLQCPKACSGARTGLGIVAVTADGGGGEPLPRSRSEGPHGAAADCTSLGMDAGVGGETCSGLILVLVVGVRLSQRKMLWETYKHS